MIYKGRNREYFELNSISSENCYKLTEQKNETLRLLWFTSDNNKLYIDSKLYILNTNDIISLTQFQKVEIGHIDTLNLLQFNRPFYCILDHDSEVGCKGILYYGSASLPLLMPEGKELEVLETAWKMATLEFEMRDNLQLEMLQMMLKRILILCTRVYKAQADLRHLDEQQNDLVRSFNYLVEKHFKTLHTVSDYASLLYKSPKTISNVFKKMGAKTPLQYIHERKMVDARRQLWYTTDDITEIAYDLGFNDLQSFSRFFKKIEGLSPSDYRTKHRGKN